MVRLKPEQLVFFERFAKSPEARLLVDVLSAELAECEHSMRTSEGAVMHRQQGRASLLDELIATINGRPAKATGGPTSALRRSAEAIW